MNKSGNQSIIMCIVSSDGSQEGVNQILSVEQ